MEKLITMIRYAIFLANTMLEQGIAGEGQCHDGPAVQADREGEREGEVREVS